MSASTGKKYSQAKAVSEDKPLLVSVKPNNRSIYFKNNGLFAENYLVNRLPYEKNDSFVMQNWETESLDEFNECYEWMLSTWDDYKDIFPTLSEAQLEDKWIRPILAKLGWTYEVQDRLKRRGKTQIPDYSLFASPQAYKKAKDCTNNEKYFGYVDVIADAKAMGINLDGTERTNANPSYQIVRYLEDTDCEWGILTDGEYWRLYSTKSKSKYTTFYEVNIRKFLSGRTDSPRDDEGFKYFFNLFRRAAFSNRDAAGKRFIDVVYESGERYARTVEKKLKARAFRIVELISSGFAGNSTSKAELSEIYEHSLYYLFRLLFVLNCESKGLLDVNNLSDYYPHSLRALSGRLKDEHERNTQWSSLNRSYDAIMSLFELIKNGDSGIGLHGFGEDLFKSGKKGFYEKNKISDSILNRIIVELACADNDDGELQFIDYAKLGPDHLGSIFEGLLEFELRKADSDLYFSADGEVCDPAKLSESAKKSCEFVKKGAVYLSASSGDRKRTGSYYTPDYVVDYVVKKVLDPICDLETTDELLKIKVCDPAMGSGHFLLGALRYLEERVLTLMYKDEEKEAKIDPHKVRFELLHNCIYGVDINPLAVELAKYSLWMYSARSGEFVERLDDQLKCGDAMDLKKSLDIEPTAYVGNPPYVNAVILSKDRDYQGVLKDKFISAIGAFDLCSLFVETCRKVSPNARIGFVLPNKLINSKGLNHYLKTDKNTYIESVDDVSTLPVFKDASVYPVILCFTDKKPKKVLVRKHLTEFDEALQFEKLDMELSDALPMVGLLGASSESTDGIKMSEIATLCGACTVAEAYELAEAISEGTGKNRVQFAVSGNIIGFVLSWGYENTRYLGRSLASPFMNLGHANVPAKRKALYLKEKIVVANMTTGLRAYVDAEGKLAPGKSTTIICDSKIPLEALAAFINSRAATEQYKNLFQALHLNGGALRIGPPELSELKIPTKLIKDVSLQKKAVDIYKKISAEMNKLLLSGTKVTAIKKSLDNRSFNGMPKLKILFSDLDALFDEVARSEVA